MEKKDMIERQSWREHLIGMPEGKEKEKIRKKLRDSIERAKNEKM